MFKISLSSPLNYIHIDSNETGSITTDYTNTTNLVNSSATINKTTATTTSKPA